MQLENEHHMKTSGAYLFINIYLLRLMTIEFHKNRENKIPFKK